jgi:IMP dehydrogenase
VDEASRPTVGEYMTRDVSTVGLDETVASVAQRIAESDDFSGLPVTDDGQVKGFISARDLLLADEDDEIATVMTEDIIVAHPQMAVQDAARVILRSGIQKLPVVDDDGALVGIISNADVVRSQIERATPGKVDKLARTLGNIHGVSTHEERRTVRLSELTPTQPTVYADELEGRVYELERGLAEPLVVIDNGGDLVLADGHHRVKAALRLGIETMDANVIVLDETVELGMSETAADSGLESVADIRIDDYARHPLVERTERLQSEE